MQKRSIFGGVAAIAVFATAAYAAVIFDPATGTGFVGKGDVQLIFGWNNKQLQDNAYAVQFRYASSETETWTCSRLTPNPNDDAEARQYQNRHRDQSIAGAPDADPRQKRGQQQFTGFILSGYDEDANVDIDGQELNSCPAGGDWVYDEGSNQTVVLGGGLEVSANGADWFPLQ